MDSDYENDKENDSAFDFYELRSTHDRLILAIHEIQDFEEKLADQFYPFCKKRRLVLTHFKLVWQAHCAHDRGRYETVEMDDANNFHLKHVSTRFIWTMKLAKGEFMDFDPKSLLRC